jgi:hypothetical protein
MKNQVISHIRFTLEHSCVVEEDGIMSRIVTRLRDGWKFTRTPMPEVLQPALDDAS